QAPVQRAAEYAVCGARGAAVLASCRGDPAKAAERFAAAETDRIFMPDASRKALYDDLFALYTQVYPAARALFSGLKRFDETYGV
ncbi:MAG: hypothetical protein ACLSDO_04340, partial [Anaerotruncus colihominis]